MRGDRLRAIREARKLTREDLALRTGVSEKQLYRYENETSDPTADALTRLAVELEVSIDYLVGLVENPTDHLREDELSPMERRLIQAVRQGLITEALKAFASLSEKDD